MGVLEMKYGAIKKNDIADGQGVRTTVFCSGCTHHCQGCFQPQTWNFDYGKEFTKEVEDELIEATKPYYITGITLLGGEPFEPENRETFVPFLKRAKEELPGKTIWAYSGYLFEQLIGKESARCGDATEMLKNVDVLVDGEFIQDKKDISLRFRGSSNQRIIDVPKSLEAGRAIPYEMDGLIQDWYSEDSSKTKDNQNEEYER